MIGNQEFFVNSNEKERQVETVFCIDINASMSSCIDAIKKSVLQWSDTLLRNSKHTGISISKIRIKLITYANDSNPILKESRWFEISNLSGLEPEYVSAYIRRIKCVDSYDEVLAFKAMDKALQVDWVSNRKCFQNIIIFTNSVCNKADVARCKKIREYFNNQDCWSAYSKRLVFFAPEVYPWPELYETCTNMAFAGCDFEHLDIDLDCIAIDMLDRTEL